MEIEISADQLVPGDIISYWYDLDWNDISESLPFVVLKIEPAPHRNDPGSRHITAVRDPRFDHIQSLHKERVFEWDVKDRIGVTRGL